ncbi:hypothetical protein TRICI_001763 [Trichomonascus ciferrii]|uniref:Major facilitator superfamily (MFS) profile domain-containing protein n=1 Tax=Trichomonascus ciferrii TaxID=44093 RepID=A0A642V7P7_9ASCO|nr:hypothetical protein TRICI_001763 [Trichomonascus ciferrii]
MSNEVNEKGALNREVSPVRDLKKEEALNGGANNDYVFNDASNVSVEGGDLYEMNDGILSKKMHMINDAMNEIGFSPYHWKLFCLNGMGYGTDSLLFFLQSVTGEQINTEYGQEFSGLVCANYIGLFCGALFWGFSSDIIGRRIAFHTTLFGTAIFAMAAAGGLNYVAVCALSACTYFSAGGNLVLDTVTFLEFLPANKQWMLTFMALWWGLGQVITCAIAWPLIANFSCTDPENCPRESNMGWRYTYIACGGFVLILALLRIFVIRMVESPKYDLSNGNDENVIRTLNKLAHSNKKECPITVEDLKAVGVVQSDSSDKTFAEKISPKNAAKSLAFHLRGLFATKKLGLSTSMNFLSWACIGLAYPLFNAFLPTYLATRGADQSDLNTTYRNNLIVNVCCIFGPVIAGGLCEVPKIGRRGTMVIGALLTMTFMFAYTAVKTPAQNLGLSCAINLCLNIYYGTLFAYTPEVLPSAHRATGNGMSVAIARGLGTIVPVVAYYTDTATVTPIYVMGAVFALMAIIAACFPYEVRGKHSM